VWRLEKRRVTFLKSATPGRCCAMHRICICQFAGTGLRKTGSYDEKMKPFQRPVSMTPRQSDFDKLQSTSGSSARSAAAAADDSAQRKVSEQQQLADGQGINTALLFVLRRFSGGGKKVRQPICCSLRPRPQLVVYFLEKNRRSQ